MSASGDGAFEGFQPVVSIGAGNREAEKYGRMWQHEEYRRVAPGEQLASVFLRLAKPRPGADVIDFGCGTGRGSLVLAVVGQMRVTMIDFVRNCLDADIADMLVTQAQVMRFIKHDLEVPLPFATEFGFCTDVMEHIPPDKVDRVLNNILRGAQHVFFSIATRPDGCGKLIGEELHLTVQPYAWWLEKFKGRGCAVHWSQEVEDYGAAMFYVTGWATGDDVRDNGVLNTTEDFARANVKHNTAQGWRQVVPHQENDLEMLVLGGGPTLGDFEAEIKERRAAGAKILTLNGSYNWALNHGLTPSATLVVDAREFNSRFVRPVVPDCQYLIASQCHPSVFEGLPKDRTWIYHTSTAMIKDLLDAAYGDAWYSLMGGSTALLRAIPLMRMLGYRKFHLYGCDSCLMTDRHHAYIQPENDGQLVIPVIVRADGSFGEYKGKDAELPGRVFYCHPWMLSQATEFVDMVKHNLGNEFELEVYGDGLLAHVLNVAANAYDAEGQAREDDEIATA
jgi:SAM-dependent methyltransferase